MIEGHMGTPRNQARDILVGNRCHRTHWFRLLESYQIDCSAQCSLNNPRKNHRNRIQGVTWKEVIFYLPPITASRIPLLLSGLCIFTISLFTTIPSAASEGIFLAIILLEIYPRSVFFIERIGENGAHIFSIHGCSRVDTRKFLLSLGTARFSSERGKWRVLS